jgi:hypothetical protein
MMQPSLATVCSKHVPSLSTNSWAFSCLGRWQFHTESELGISFANEPSLNDGRRSANQVKTGFRAISARTAPRAKFASSEILYSQNVKRAGKLLFQVDVRCSMCFASGGVEPTKTSLSRAGASSAVPISIPKTVPKLPVQPRFTSINALVNH